MKKFIIIIIILYSKYCGSGGSYTPDFTDFSVLYGNGYTYVAINGYIIGLS